MSNGNVLIPRRIAFRATATAITAYMAALSMYMPWFGTSSRGLGDIGCAFTFVEGGGCDYLESPPSYTDHAAAQIVGIWPALVLFSLGALATLAAFKRSRRAQKATGVLAIVLTVLLGPYVFGLGITSLPGRRGRVDDRVFAGCKSRGCD